MYPWSILLVRPHYPISLPWQARFYEILVIRPSRNELSPGFFNALIGVPAIQSQWFANFDMHDRVWLKCSNLMTSTSSRLKRKLTNLQSNINDKPLRLRIRKNCIDWIGKTRLLVIFIYHEDATTTSHLIKPFPVKGHPEWRGSGDAGVTNLGGFL